MTFSENTTVEDPKDNKESDEKAVIKQTAYDLENLKKESQDATNQLVHLKRGTVVPPLNFSETIEGYAKSHYTLEERKLIDVVMAKARDFEGTKYQMGGLTKDGIDCSGLRSVILAELYKNKGKKFNRLVAANFDSKAPDISVNEVETGDRMFWEDPDRQEGWPNEKGQKITHIEMIVSKPYMKDGKRFVNTYGSSANKEGTDLVDKKLQYQDGVGYRVREITDIHHFGKPPYYSELVAMDKKTKITNKGVV